MNKQFKKFRDNTNIEVYYDEVNCESSSLDTKKEEKMEEENMAMDKIMKERQKRLESLKNLPILKIGVDAGNGNVKYSYRYTEKSGKNKKLIAHSNYLESNVTLKTDLEDEDTTIINEVGYNFRTTDKVIDVVKRSKDTKEHRGLLYKALMEISKETGYKRFKVVFGCSIDSWLEKGEREKIKKTMLENRILEIKDRGSVDYLEIVDLEVQPECAVGIYGFSDKTLEALSKEDFLLVDIGNLNIGFVRYLKGLKRDKNLKINCDGMNTILTRIREQLNIKDLDRRPVSVEQVKRYLLDKEKYKKEIFKRRENVIQEYIDGFIANLIKTAIDSFDGDLFANTKIVFIGGGAEALKRYLPSSVEKVVDTDEDNFETLEIEENLLVANAKAFRERAMRLFKDEA